MTVNAGVLRSAESLAEAAPVCAGEVAGDDLASGELRNLVTVGRLLCAAALAREERRGAHTRTDYPEMRDDLRVPFIAGGRSSASRP
jgi:succinate dehydrogenase/fumarate reductase flavoprotein subunit